MWRASQTPRVEKVQFHLLFSDLSTCHYIIIILFDHLSFPDSATCFHVWPRFIFLLVHMSSLGFVTCHYLLWPCVLSQFSQVPLSYQATSPFQVHPRLFFLVCPRVIFVLAHALYLGSTTQHFPIGTHVLQNIAHVAFFCLYACQFMISTHVRFLFSCMSVSECQYPKLGHCTCPY